MGGSDAPRRVFYEFFAGGGMARLGLGRGWGCALANDVDAKKAASYAANFGDDHLRLSDVAALTTADAPGRADLAWASFPCQDLSLAGGGAGLRGARSGVFWSFWRLIEALAAERRAPRMVALENVCGLLSSHGGRDFAAVLGALGALGYRAGALVLDAAHFRPQSRPRLFIIGVSADIEPGLCAGMAPEPGLSPPALLNAVARLDASARAAHLWWRPGPPPRRRLGLGALLEPSAPWRTPCATERLLGHMTAAQAEKLAAAQARAARLRRPVYGALFARGRPDGLGGTRQRVELRFDGLAGCLRTPAGGSSRQALIRVCADGVATRLFSPREAARLMGLPERYRLPSTGTDAYHLLGDGVAVPAVRWLARRLMEPLLDGQGRLGLGAAA